MNLILQVILPLLFLTLSWYIKHYQYCIHLGTTSHPILVGMSILGGTFDESCTVTIVNNLSCDLTLKDKECSWYSGWEINPPQTIGKAQQGTYKIYDATRKQTTVAQKSPGTP